MRLILTFPSLHNLLAAEKALRLSGDAKLKCRSTPTPPGLGDEICGVSLEILDHENEADVLLFLAQNNLAPKQLHRLS